MKYKFLLALALCISLFTSCNKGKTNPPFSPIGQDEIPNNEIWYTTTDGKEVFPLVTDGFGAKYISTTYREDKGIMLFEAAVTDIPAGAFAYSDPLETMTLPKTVKTIGDYAFDQCRGLMDINLDEGIETIGKHAFCSCEKLTRGMTFPKSLTKISAEAFKDVYLPTITFSSDNVPTVEETAFSEDLFFLIKVPADKYDDYKSNLGYYSKYMMTNHTVTKDDSACWMKYLPDAMPLYMITIPGSHDADTYDCHCLVCDYSIIFGNWRELLNIFAQDQGYDLAEQCNLGSRYFDLRPAVLAGIDDNGISVDFYRNPGGAVHVFHGYQNLYSLGANCDDFTADIAMFQMYICGRDYKDAVEDLITWVKQNNTEFLIVDSQMEIYDSSDPQRDITRDKVVSFQKDWIANGDVVPFRPGLTLGDVRGKVLLLDESDLSEVDGAAIFNEDKGTLGNSNGVVYYTKQSDYKYDHADYQWDLKKLGSIQSQAEKYAKMDKTREIWNFNQTNGVLMDNITIIPEFDIQIPILEVPFPAEFAQEVQPLVANYIQNGLPDGPAGIISMDFVGVNGITISNYSYNVRGDELPSLIFLHNFK